MKDKLISVKVNKKLNKQAKVIEIILNHQIAKQIKDYILFGRRTELTDILYSEKQIVPKPFVIEKNKLKKSIENKIATWEAGIRKIKFNNGSTMALNGSKRAFSVA